MMNPPHYPTAPIQPEIRRTTNDSVYQIAIILAAFLLVISASLF